MIAVIFEVWPKADRKQDYLNIAGELKPLLEKIDGFISIERFESLYEPGKILSLSFFRDEAAVQAWRTTNEHRVAQAKGRGEIFANYRLRVAGVIRDYGMRERAQVPDDSLKNPWCLKRSVGNRGGWRMEDGGWVGMAARGTNDLTLLVDIVELTV